LPVYNAYVDVLFSMFVLDNNTPDITANANITFELEGARNYTICLVTNNQNVYANAQMEYFAENYSQRDYYLYNWSLDNNTNVSNMAHLWLLEEENTTEVTVYVQDEVGSGVENVYVEAYRFDVGKNSYKLVQSEKTNTGGSALFNLQLKDSLYSWILKTNGTIVKSTIASPTKLTSTSKYFTIDLKESITEGRKILADQMTDLYFVNATKMFIFTWLSTSNTVRSADLIVSRVGTKADVVVCANNSIGTTGILTCKISETTADNTYTARAYIDTMTLNSNYTVGTLVASFDKGYERWGKTGLLVGVMLIMALGLVFISNGALVIVGIIGALIFLGIAGIISFGILPIVSLIILGAIIMVKIRQ
jgi:hypothetical protein